MFTKENKRLIVRGNSNSVNIDVDDAKEMRLQGYKWSGHTHPGLTGNVLISSYGDKLVLRAFEQERSVVYNSKGLYEIFYRE
jgi:hypothetical protein